MDLQRPDYDVYSTGIYIIDDDGLRAFAGPFVSEATAIAWPAMFEDCSTRRPISSTEVDSTSAEEAAVCKRALAVGRNYIPPG